MEMPALNTQGIDFTNTLLKIEQMKTNALQRQHLQKQNALLEAEMDPALRAAKIQKLKDDSAQSAEAIEASKTNRAKAVVTAIKDGISAIDPDIPGAYPAAVKFLTEHPTLKASPTLFPDVSVFEKTDETGAKVFDKDLFTRWQDRVTRSADDIQKGVGTELKTVYHNDGRTMSVPVPKNKGYDPVKALGVGWSFENPVDKKRVDLTEDLRKETERHNRELEKNYATAEARQSEQERHNREIEKIMMKNADTNARKVDKDKPKVYRNSSGHALIFKDEKFYIQDVDADGSMGWREAKPEETVGVEHPSAAKKKGGGIGLTGVLAPGETTPATGPTKQASEWQKYNK